ncbi:conserved hypothetical protein [Burkholderia pseudomallei 406e]|nr:conserved hypothetical protein [Burkholderia pseudomallei 406e]
MMKTTTLPLSGSSLVVAFLCEGTRKWTTPTQIKNTKDN